MNSQQQHGVNSNQFNDSCLHKIHFYATEEELKQRQLISSIAFDEIIEEGLIDSEKINEIYSYINHKIIYFKYIGNPSYKDQSQQEYCNYLKFKLTIYYKYYGNQGKSKEINLNQMHIFQAQKLLPFFIQIGNVKKNIKRLAKKIFGDHNRKLKIDTFLLIQNLQNLLRQIKNAAFPHLLFPNSLDYLEIFSTTHHFNQFEKDMINKQSAVFSQFKLEEEHAMKNSILQINDWIQSLEYQLKAKQKNIQNKTRQSKIILDQLFMIETSILINKLKILKIKHEAVAYLCWHNHKKIEPNLQFLIKIVNQDPLKKYSTDDILDIVSGKRQAWLYLQQYFRYHKNLIEVVQMLNQTNKNTDSFQSLLVDIVFLLEKWIIITKYQQNQLLLFENYIVVLRIHKNIDPSFISLRQDNVFHHLMNYLQQMISHLAHYHRQLIQKIPLFDQQLTYKILTSNTIVSTVLSLQNDFVSLINQISPLMEVMVVLEEIKSKQSQKITLISNILSKIVYLSLMRIDSMFLITKSKIIMENVIGNIELILLSQTSDFFQQFKPYLQQIKYILMLVDIIRHKKSKENMGKFQQEQYQRLKQIAAYFSKERPECPIYELKGKILLFITLFRMGFHVPSLKIGGKAINLRNRILNLYSKLYSNTSGEFMQLSKLNSLMVVSASKRQDYIVFSPSKPELYEVVKDSSNVQDNRYPDDEDVYITASFKPITKIHDFINNHMTNSQINCKKYLQNLLNILQHQLFVIQRQNSIQTASILSNHYIASVKMSIDNEDNHYNLINFNTLLQIQRFCFLQRYDIAWKLLLKEKKENQNIAEFLSQLSISNHQNNEIFQFVRIHTIIQRMNHFFNHQNKQQSILQITEILNNNSIYSVPTKAVEFLFNTVYEEKRLKKLQQFYQRSLKNQSQNIEDFIPIKNRFNSQFIKITKKDLQNRNIIMIEIDEVFKEKFKGLKQELKKYYLLNQIGLYKVSNVKEKNFLLIELQSNRYNEFNIKQIKKSFIQTQQSQQNLAQKLTKNLIINIFQANQYFYNRKKSSSILNNQQIEIDYENYSYSINPFCILIDKILNNNGETKENSQFQINFECSKIIEARIFPYLSQFSDHFKSSYYYLLEALRAFKEHKIENFQFTKLLSHPFFMNLQEKQVFIIYFDNKMSQMCDKFHIKEAELKKQKNIPQLEKNIMNRMKDSTYKNYSYNFIIGGILQLQMIQLNICSQDKTDKLDWISKHSKNLFSYELPKRQNGQIKEYAYSLNIFLKYLRGALAHKMDNNSSTILSILQQYPKMINFLYYHKSLLQMKYDQVIKIKNQWVNSYFSITRNELTFLKKYIYQPDKYNFPYGQDIKESLSTLKLYSSQYQIQVRNRFKNKSYKCDKCKIMIKIIQQSHNLFDLFFFLKNKETQYYGQILSAEHSFRQCFISQYLRQNRLLKIFGGLLKRTEARQFFIINWWFYLESMFPCLILHLNRIRFLFLLQ